eukprot:m.349717 g.349717  ORF g.349717 m.349717 type:complete len:62 (+) comp43632_c0_seq1:269-454(+)
MPIQQQNNLTQHKQQQPTPPSSKFSGLFLRRCRPTRDEPRSFKTIYKHKYKHKLRKQKQQQ